LEQLALSRAQSNKNQVKIGNFKDERYEIHKDKVKRAIEILMGTFESNTSEEKKTGLNLADKN
jgi:hypothetical protein